MFAFSTLTSSPCSGSPWPQTYYQRDDVEERLARLAELELLEEERQRKEKALEKARQEAKELEGVGGEGPAGSEDGGSPRA